MKLGRVLPIIRPEEERPGKNFDLSKYFPFPLLSFLHKESPVASQLLSSSVITDATLL